MEWPFVSRKKFDELAARLAKLEEEQKSAPVPEVAKPPMTYQGKKRGTYAQLKALVNEDIQRRLNTPNSLPISVELQMAALQGRRDNIGH